MVDLHSNQAVSQLGSPLCVFLLCELCFLYLGGITSCCVSALLQQSLVFMLSFHTAKIFETLS